jgi:hypothetical protein
MTGIKFAATPFARKVHKNFRLLWLRRRQIGGNLSVGLKEESIGSSGQSGGSACNCQIEHSIVLSNHKW